MLDVLKALIINPDDQCLSQVFSFLKENHSKITRRLYSGQEYSKYEAIYRVYRYLGYKDPSIVSFVLQDQNASFEEALYSLITKDSGICDLTGQKKQFRKKENSFVFCGSPSSCACWATERTKTKESTLEKIKHTTLSRYGVENVQQTDWFKNKVKKSNLDKYGVENVFQRQDLQDSIKEANLERHGVEYTFQRDDVKSKIKETNQTKYGVNYSSEREEVRLKIKQKRCSPEALLILLDEILLREQLSKYSVYTLADKLGICASTVYDYCKKYDIKFEISSYETEIAQFLEDNNIKFIQNTKKIISHQDSRLELDFYIEDFRLAIEFNGIYWHSEAIVDRNYHKRKWEACKKSGIRLLMINEDEWIERSVAIKKKILNLCGRSERGYGARNLTIMEVPIKISKKFADLHHIQRSSYGSFLAYGAYLNDQLVAIISFNRQRRTGKIELSRFCTDGKIYAGLFSKMLSYIVKHNQFSEIITFADLRYSDGNLYEQTGFERKKVIPPDYRYFKGITTYHKSTFKKKNIERKFGLDLSSKTEHEAMLELGFLRIYDCGKIKYVLNTIV